jgi:hypothetical protein
MATTMTFFRFRIGEHWVCLEDGGGYLANSEPPLYDHVSISIRPDKNGKPGPIESRTLAVRRDQIAAIAIQFLMMAHTMTPRSMYQRSERFGSAGQEPKIVPKAWAVDPELLKRFLDDVTPGAIFEKADQLRRRSHILQSCLVLLERLPDDQAKQLGGLLSWMENNDQPVAIQVTALGGENAGALLSADPSQAKH